jgi:hypothetical protein
MAIVVSGLPQKRNAAPTPNDRGETDGRVDAVLDHAGRS